MTSDLVEDVADHLKRLRVIADDADFGDEDSCHRNNGSGTSAVTDPVVSSDSLLLVCDLGYGLPKEAKPQKEKILAITRQIVNFLLFQHQSLRENKYAWPACRLLIVLGTTAGSQEEGEIANIHKLHQTIHSRLKELWRREVDPSLSEFPDQYIEISHKCLPEVIEAMKTKNNQSNEEEVEKEVVYLSPDANTILRKLPRIVIVGMLIDRRTIQVNRSLLRANQFQVNSARWPLEDATAGNSAWNVNEPLNVDCILEGMALWYWNKWQGHDDDIACMNAIRQALRHHEERHPERPRHIIS
jgi:hypothetical protein